MQVSDNENQLKTLSQLMDGEWHGLDAAKCVADMCDDESLQGKWARYHIIRDCINSEPVQSDLSLVSRICDAIDDEPTYSNVHSIGGGIEHDISELAARKADGVDQYDAPDLSDEWASGYSAAAAQSKKSSWANTGLAGFALAASVALVTVVGLDIFEQQGTQTQPTTIAATDAATEASLPSASTVVQDTSVAENVQQANLPVVEFVSNTGGNTGGYWVAPNSAQATSNEDRINKMLSQHIEKSPASVRTGLLPHSRLVGVEEAGQSR